MLVPTATLKRFGLSWVRHSIVRLSKPDNQKALFLVTFASVELCLSVPFSQKIYLSRPNRDGFFLIAAAWHGIIELEKRDLL